MRRRSRRVVRRRACPTRGAPRTGRERAAQHAQRSRLRRCRPGRSSIGRRRRRTRRSCSRCRRRDAPPSRISADRIAQVVGDVRAPWSATRGRSDWPTARRCRPPNRDASSARATGCDGTRKPDAVLAAGDDVVRRDRRAARSASAVPARTLPPERACAGRELARPMRGRRASAGGRSRGWSAGRPFAAKIRAHGVALPASAPRP